MSRIKNLPTGWQRKRLEKVAIIQTGIAKNQNSNEECIELPYLRVANVQDGFLDLSEIKTIKVHKDKATRYRLENGDVLLTEGGDFDKLGRGAVWEGQIQNCVHQNHVFAVRPNKSELLPSFLSAQTGSSYGKRFFLSCSKQSTNLASINTSQLRAFPVLLPPFPEQKAIADLLSTWDKAIEKTEWLIQMKDKRFRRLLQELISNPKNTEKNDVWNEFKLGQICKVTKGKQLNVAHMKNDGAYYALNGGIAPSGRTDGWNTEAETITISEGGNSCGYVNYNTERFWSGGHCYSLLSLKKNVDKHYLYFYLKMNEPKLMKLRVGSGLPNIQKNDVVKFVIALPSLAEQQQIAQSLFSARREIDLLKQLTEKYKTQKRGLMHKMLTGTWRVKPDVVKTFEETKS
ncbi:MAG: restriction endonuclease subunit S [Desulfobacteraceae bacterium]|nr:restriction endonuclease subunit S [Desulfobacteraceae bacterium]